MVIVALCCGANGVGTPSASAAEPLEVYYDYMTDDGVLSGGHATLETPSSAPSAVQMLTEPLSYNVYTLVDNGPCENRIDLVFVGDGYTALQMGLYAQHVQTILNGMLQEPPLNRYASFFNVHVVEVISNQSGVDEIDNNIYRDTALDMAFDGRQLSIDFVKAWNAANLAPDGDVLIALANSSRYGGIGYTKTCTVSGANASTVELALHEFGHAFAKLADEYYSLDGSVYSGSEPTQSNVSIYTASEMMDQQLKWYRWLDQGGISTYQGAKTKQYGIYRPVNISKMQTLGYPFGAVNSEQFVLKIYETVSPIDQAAPTAASPVMSETTFTVDCRIPQPDTLQFRWRIDGVTIPGAETDNFCPADASAYLLPNTVQTLTVTVTDTTDLVRDEVRRAALMTDERQWQIWTASADLTGNGGMTDLAGFALAWLTDDPAYDRAPAEPDGIVDLLDFAVFAANWNDPPALAPDGAVDMFDLMEMSADWLTSGSPCDIAPAGGDGIVDLQDFAVLTAQWTGS